MLEKLAEIVRGEAERTGATEEFPACMACDFAPRGSPVCKNRWCLNPSNEGGSLMLARWAVLLVAKGLGIHREDDKIVSAPGTDYRLLCLIAEAKEAGE